MHKLALEHNLASYGGRQRIPNQFGYQGLTSPPVNYRQGIMENGNAIKKPSRLDQMQSQIQTKLLREKEQKIIQLYEENQNRALQKVNQQQPNKKGLVREFFNERRTNGSNSGRSQHSNSMSPSMEHMYKQKKMEQIQQQKQIQPKSGFGFNANHYQSQGLAPSQKLNGHYQPQQTSKASAGRDRSNLLEPIQRKPGKNNKDNPFPKKAQIVRPRTYGSIQNKENYDLVPKSAPTGFSGMDSDGLSDDTPPPNPKQLRALQEKRKLLQSQRSNKSHVSITSTQTAPTDFQRWQMEQEKNRANRLQKHRDMNGGGFIQDEGFDDNESEMMSQGHDAVADEMKRKQKELLAQIESQQRELDRLREERVQEEQEEAKENVRRKKLEEERRRKTQEEERRRRKAEEEERVKREWEEEKMKRTQEEKQRLRKQSETSRTYDCSDDDEDGMGHGYHGKKSTPKPQSKPASTRKPQPPSLRKAPKSTQRQSSPKTGDHTAFYENADQIEGAFEDTGRLASCRNCGRKFAEDRLSKHEKACKNATKKRKVMDPSKLRTAGTEMEQYVNNRQPAPKPKKSNWRSKHEEFQNAIKYAKKMKEIEENGGNLADLPPPPPSENLDYVQCPHCTRRFNAGTAERHIPHCKNTKSRPAPPRKR